MPEAPIEVRLCTAADLPALIARESNPAANFSQAQFDMMSAGDYYYAIALRDDEPLGTGALDCRASKLCPELKNLWVYPTMRRQGAARAITTYLEGQAAARGFVEVFLRVDPDNEAAIPMYIGLEYTPTGDHIETNYDQLGPDGQVVARTQVDAVYRKSLTVR
ncbi:acetyltransferase (GNAT) family protein [Propionicimonas paludicola]|uniref:Acetyltransferase (GNAT) family protein n=1 Tax=Propionicimonas paludicola TaxID=185243 RepID=A0A2A9CQM1_9ACTN|nr:GNAT family N-acetyltransferase [Propionicimonas paludicola]PFG16416.1 acetyltransferase (GNAT) family protein [Propionicimonas paludicola]